MSVTGDMAERIQELEAVNAELLAALERLCNVDATYVANQIHIPCSSHGDAIGRMAKARAAISRARGRS